MGSGWYSFDLSGYSNAVGVSVAHTCVTFKNEVSYDKCILLSRAGNYDRLLIIVCHAGHMLRLVGNRKLLLNPKLV